MTFKESVFKDIENIFFNLNEFAEVCDINGKEVSVVIDNDKMEQLAARFDRILPMQEIYQKLILFYCCEVDFKVLPEINENIMFNGELFQIINITNSSGILEILIGAAFGR